MDNFLIDTVWSVKQLLYAVRTNNLKSAALHTANI